jgi:outer membrane receptor protein involved in Fe transport
LHTSDHARVSAAHRSSYLRRLDQRRRERDNLTPNLRVSIEGQNLTDTPLRYGRDSRRNDTLLYVHSGRSFVLGANYKF